MKHKYNKIRTTDKKLMMGFSMGSSFHLLVM
jgi:hypothetical protein